MDRTSSRPTSPKPLIALLLASIAGLGLIQGLWAQPPEAPIVSVPSSPPDPTVPDQGVLVLRSGRVVEGRITASANGYVVHRDKGNFLVPYDLILLQARDIHDAYDKQKRTMTVPTAENHMLLAKWCMTYQLFDEAKEQLKQAIIMEPARQEAREMLIRLEELMKLDQPTESATTKTPEPRQVEVEPIPTESLARLSEQTTLQFVRKIQPLVVNKCGNARCHGSAGTSSFRISHVRSGTFTNQVNVERNLAALLQQIDPDQPAKSPLIQVPSEGHGTGGRPIFVGNGGQIQQRLLWQWTQTVAKELRTQRERDGSQPRLVSKQPSKPTSHDTVRQVSGQTAATPQKSVIPADADSEESADEQTLREILGDSSADPFDPAAFNRRHHQ